MKTCSCGGFLYAHGHYLTKSGGKSERYICKVCGKSITVRDGVILSQTGARKKDWRTEDAQK